METEMYNILKFLSYESLESNLTIT